jgi:hypothetical protein
VDSGDNRREDATLFYQARDRRTMQYGASPDALTRPVSLVLAPGVLKTRDGLTAASALTDMLMRVHRRVRLVEGTTTDADGGTTGILQQLHDTARAIDPFQNTDRAAGEGELVILVTGRSSTPSPSNGLADIVVCWSGGRGEVHIRGEAPDAGEDDALDAEATPALHLLGACTAACLAAAAAFRLVHGDAPAPAAVNILERTEGASASTASVAGPIDVGDVQVVGAGAVAHALSFWAREFGTLGAWEFVDGDLAEVHNTNRCLSMSAATAGWPDGVATGGAEHKATSAAAVMGADATKTWFDELDAHRKRADIVLVLANERNVRAEVSALGEPLLVHATTSPNWTAELHRHLAGVDDCPACRIPERFQPLPTCSTGPARPDDETSGDAALPFLSATAGLMLAASLLDLSNGQTFLEGRFNHWPLNMTLSGRLWQRVPHPNQCPHVLAPEVRRVIQSSDPRRWDALETA